MHFTFQLKSGWPAVKNDIPFSETSDYADRMFMQFYGYDDLYVFHNPEAATLCLLSQAS